MYSVIICDNFKFGTKAVYLLVKRISQPSLQLTHHNIAIGLAKS